MRSRGAFLGAAATALAAGLWSPTAAEVRPTPLEGDGACGASVVRLPLPDGMTTGTVGGGRGERILLGGEAPGPRGGAPLLWRRTGCRSWQVTDLGDGGRVEGEALSMADDGSVLLMSGVVRTADGRYHHLRPLPGFERGPIVARQMNRAGVIAGNLFAADGRPQAAVWTSWRHRPRALRPLPLPGAVDSLARGINDLGDVPGASCNLDCSDGRGGVWPRGRARGLDLAGLGGSPFADPFKVNDSRTVVGAVCNADCTVQGAAVWRDLRRLRFLAPLPGDDTAVLLAVSDDGRAAGESSTFDGARERVAYWPGHGPLRALPPLPGHPRSVAHFVSERGLVAGASFSVGAPDSPVPTVWTRADEQASVGGPALPR